MFRFALFLLIGVSCAHATSIVVKLDKQNIVIAADTLGIDATGGVHQDQCKIVVAGRTAFAATGIASFTPSLSSPLPAMSSWDAKSEATTAYAANTNDLGGAANEWLTKAEQYFTRLPPADQRRARSLTGGDPDNVLVGGVFVGWSPSGTPELIMEYVRYEKPYSGRVQHLVQILPIRDLPYTTNAVTQRLFETDLTLMRATAAKWKNQAKGFPESERTWRWLEFLIRQTSEYAKVGTTVDVLELRQHGQPVWLQNLTCK
ncbi:MAG TPA: hypothetical protein VIJ79_02325 [Acidobacteriaceae bacterium]